MVQVGEIDWQNRGHFLAVASTIMRRILVDHARAKHAQKRGGNAHRAAMEESLGMTPERADVMVRLDECLVRMAAAYPRAAKAVEHVYFGGLSNEDAAQALEISLATLERDLRFGRAWLAREWSARADA